ncbi:MFS transporter [Sphingomonas sp. HF-S3]|uniref:MFS transporter n=1 Tax=Sphingomonas rustica TaxID=3103142 RepID=A0ABV0B899_9SPHN
MRRPRRCSASCWSTIRCGSTGPRKPELRGEARRLILLGAIAALGSLAIQIIVPALPILSRGIGTPPTGGQLVISVYLITLALGQLVWAPVADHHGRRPVLLGGLGLFLIGTLCCAVAGNLTAMLIGRAIQAIGASSSLVTARAMATDRAPAGHAAAPLAILTSVTLISPAIAPVLGGALTGLAGWRALFWVLAGLTVIGMVLASRMLAETRAGDHAPLHPGRLAATYWQVLSHRGYLPLVLSNALISAGFYLFLAVSPFALNAAGATPALSGLFYSLVACAIIAGTLTVPVVLRHRPTWLTPIGTTALAAGAAAVITVALAGTNLLGLLAAMALIAFGSGLTGPALLAQAIERQRARASAATSLFGTIQMGGAALISTAAVRFSPSADLDLALIGVLVGLALVTRRLSGGAPDPA